MKREMRFEFYNRLFALVQILLFMVSSLLITLLLMGAMNNDVSVLGLIEKDLIYSNLYLMSMFHAICFIELFFIKKNLQKGEHIEGMLLNIILLCIAQIFLLNVIVVASVIIFLYKTMKTNHISIRYILKVVKDKKEIALPISNALFFVISIVMIYTMIIYQIG